MEPQTVEIYFPDESMKRYVLTPTLNERPSLKLIRLLVKRGYPRDDFLLVWYRNSARVKVIAIKKQRHLNKVLDLLGVAADRHYGRDVVCRLHVKTDVPRPVEPVQLLPSDGMDITLTENWNEDYDVHSGVVVEDGSDPSEECDDPDVLTELADFSRVPDEETPMDSEDDGVSSSDSDEEPVRKKRRLLRTPGDYESGGWWYACLVCGLTFASRSAARRHMIGYHKAGDPVRCGRCRSDCREKDFESPEALTEHIELEHGKIPEHICQSCWRIFPTADLLASHEPYHADDNPVSCDVCGLKFFRPRDCTVHRTLVHQDPVAKSLPECADCNKCFVNRAAYIAHMQKFHRPGSKATDSAGLSVSVDLSAEELDTDGMPIDATIFECNTCGHAFRKIGNLTAHINRIHTVPTDSALVNFDPSSVLDKANPQCQQCDKIFSNIYNLQNHMRKSVDGKCPGQTIRVRTENAPNRSCQYCGKVFASRGNLTHHSKRFPDGICASRLDVDEKKECSHCGKVFVNSWKFEGHQTEFPNGACAGHRKDTTCTSCGKNFSSPYNLAHHVKRFPDGQCSNWGPVGQSLTCEHCGKNFSNAYFISSHKTKFPNGACAEEDRRYCESCGRIFKNRYTRKAHEERFPDGSCPKKTVAELTEEFCCQNCGRTFRIREDLDKHSVENPGGMCRLGDERSCETCGKDFSSRTCWINHRVSFPKGTCVKQVCEVCGHSFINGRMFSTHQARFQTGSCADLLKRDCEKCGKTFHSRYSLLNHLEIFKNGSCRRDYDACGKIFTTAPLLAFHKKKYSNGSCFEMEKLRCGHCERYFPSQEALDVHKEKYPTGLCSSELVTDAENSPVCVHCDKPFSTRSNLQKHAKRFPGGTCRLESSTSGGACSRIFVRSDGLLAHQTRYPDGSCGALLIFGENDRRDCEICGKVFSTPLTLSNHKSSFPNGSCSIEDRECQKCQRVFQTGDRLDSHKERYQYGECVFVVAAEKEGRLICEDCGKKFSALPRFEAHRSAFPNGECAAEEKLDCEGCGKKFKSGHSYRAHKGKFPEKSCSGLYAFGKDDRRDCNVCGKIYAMPATLMAHKKRFPNGSCAVTKNECAACWNFFPSVDKLRAHIKDFPDGSCENAVLESDDPCKTAPVEQDDFSESASPEAEDPLCCDRCGRTDFASPAGLAKHAKKCSDDDDCTEDIPALCIKCGKTFQNSLVLDDHVMQFPNGSCGAKASRQECQNCKKTFSSVTMLQQHAVRFPNGVCGGRTEYPCDTCGMVFPTSAGWNNHKKFCRKENGSVVRNGNERNTSESSGRRKTFTNSALVVSSHSPTCEACKKAFTSENTLKSHQLSYRNGLCGAILRAAADKTQCDLCGMKFSSPWDLGVHKISFPGGRCRGRSAANGPTSPSPGERLPFSPDGIRCTVCSEKLNTWSEMQLHRKKCPSASCLISVKECDSCRTDFADPAALTQHRVSFPNGTCGLVFASDTVRFPCSHCASEFSSQEIRAAHTAEVHPSTGFCWCECGLACSSEADLAQHKESCDSPLSQKVKCSCQTCGRVFLTIGDLFHHAKGGLCVNSDPQSKPTGGRRLDSLMASLPEA